MVRRHRRTLAQVSDQTLGLVSEVAELPEPRLCDVVAEQSPAFLRLRGLGDGVWSGPSKNAADASVPLYFPILCGLLVCAIAWSDRNEQGREAQ